MSMGLIKESHFESGMLFYEGINKVIKSMYHQASIKVEIIL